MKYLDKRNAIATNLYYSIILATSLYPVEKSKVIMLLVMQIFLSLSKYISLIMPCVLSLTSLTHLCLVIYSLARNRANVGSTSYVQHITFKVMTIHFNTDTGILPPPETPRTLLELIKFYREMWLSMNINTLLLLYCYIVILLCCFIGFGNMLYNLRCTFYFKR